MPKKNTRKRREGARQRSVLEISTQKVSNLVAYAERKEHEEDTWEDYIKRIENRYQDYCPQCALNLLCMTGRKPADILICTRCASLYTKELKLVIRCDGFMVRAALATLWQTGNCPCCSAVFTQVAYTVIRGFSVDAPAVEALKIHRARLEYNRRNIARRKES